MINDLVKQYKSGVEFCRAVGINNKQFLTSIKKGESKIPIQLALTLHRMFGDKAKLYEMRPDIYPEDIFKK